MVSSKFCNGQTCEAKLDKSHLIQSNQLLLLSVLIKAKIAIGPDIYKANQLTNEILSY